MGFGRLGVKQRGLYLGYGLIFEMLQMPEVEGSWENGLEGGGQEPQEF